MNVCLTTTDAFPISMEKWVFSFSLQNTMHNVSRRLWDECETSLKPLVYSCREKIWLVHLVASHSAGQWSCVMATDPEGRLWDERESHHAHTWIYYTPYALSYKAGSPRRPPQKKALQCSPESWQHLASKTLMNNFSDKYSTGNSNMQVV